MMYLFHQHGAYIIEISRRLAKKLGGLARGERINWLNGILRRWAHAVEFLVLMVLTGFAFDSWLWLMHVCL